MSQFSPKMEVITMPSSWSCYNSICYCLFKAFRISPKSYSINILGRHGGGDTNTLFLMLEKVYLKKKKVGKAQYAWRCKIKKK